MTALRLQLHNPHIFLYYDMAMMTFNWRQVERVQTDKEERVNSILHIIGAGLSLSGLAVLVVLSVLRHQPLQLLAFVIYGMSLFFLYAMSSLYHGIQNKKLKPVLARMDYTAIFILIAGSYTPVALVVLRHQTVLSWGLFAAVWAMALAGSVATFLWVRRIGVLNILIYAAMGSLSIFLIPVVFRIMGLPIIIFAAAGGLVYIAGIYFFGVSKFRYHHAVWHSFVLAGSLIHYFTIILFVR